MAKRKYTYYDARKGAWSSRRPPSDEEIKAAKLRVETAEKSFASTSMMVASSKQSVQMAAQMLESAKKQLKQAQSDKSSAEKELEEARTYLNSIDGGGGGGGTGSGKENSSGGGGKDTSSSDTRRKIRYSLGRPTNQHSVSPFPGSTVKVKVESDAEGRKSRDAGGNEEEDQLRKKKTRRDEYQITVDRTTIRPGGQGGRSIMTLDVTSSTTIRDVKGKIPVHPDAQVLRYEGTTLEDGRTLAECNITKGSVLSLSFNLHRYAFIPMQVHVKTLTGKSVTVRVTPSNTVRDIKDEIQHEASILPERQRLIYHGSELDNDHKLSTYGIVSQSTLQLVTVREIPIHVENLTGQTFTLKVATSDKVKLVKHMLKDKVGIPTNLQRLLFAGSVMEDSQPLSHYNVQCESTLHLVNGRKITGS